MTTAVLLLASLVAAEPPEGENVYRAAKVGDWTEYKTKDTVMRQTAVAKTDDALTMRIDQTINGEKSTPHEFKVDLKKPYPPEASPNKDVVITREPLGSGTETL